MRTSLVIDKHSKKKGKSLLRRDGKWLLSKCGRYFFDEQAADHAVKFFAKYLRHCKGEWAGKKLILEPWQKNEIIAPLFGWKRVADGTRKYRVCWVEVPRKNGKSTLAGGVALYLLRADREPGAEVYSAAADREQAAIVFNSASAMLDAAPALQKRLLAHRKVITDRKDRTVFYKVLSADAFRQHGLNAHGVLFDEVHTQPNRKLWDVLKTSTGSRRQPIVFAITTAGDDTDSLCYELHEYARRIKEGLIEDDSWLVVMYGADEKADWTDPEVWKRANPNYGVSIKADYLAAECKLAQRLPRYENTFRRLHLNQWVSQVVRWIPMREWDQCGGSVEDIEDLIEDGWICYAGLDLSSVRDMTSLVLVFRKGHRVKVIPFFWVPQENVDAMSDENRVNYAVWVRHGHLLTTPGNAIDHDAIIEKIKEIRKKYKLKIRELAFDRFGARYIINKIDGIGVDVVEFGQGYQMMNDPCKRLERMVLRHELEHGGHPVLRWNADNVVVDMNPAGDIKPNKEKSSKKIDGVVALLMGIGIAFAVEAKKSKYDAGGFTSMGRQA